MSWQACPDPAPGNMHVPDLIETVIVPRARDLGGFEVRRALPSLTRQMVGPFPHHIWWNFVSSRPERIEQAKADWKARPF